MNVCGNIDTTTARVVGVLLMLPIGIIVLLVLFYLGAFGEGYFPGEFLIILLVITIALLIARLVFWGSRRKRWPNY